MLTKSKIAVFFGLVLATVSAAAGTPHQGNFRSSQLALAKVGTPAVLQPSRRISAQKEQWFNHQTTGSTFYMGKATRSLFETNF